MHVWNSQATRFRSSFLTSVGIKRTLKRASQAHDITIKSYGHAKDYLSFTNNSPVASEVVLYSREDKETIHSKQTANCGVYNGIHWDVSLTGKTKSIAMDTRQLHLTNRRSVVATAPTFATSIAPSLQPRAQSWRPKNHPNAYPQPRPWTSQQPT